MTEDDCNEIKQDISALRFELIELMGRRAAAAVAGNINGGGGGGGNRNSVTMIGSNSNGSSSSTTASCANLGLNGSANGSAATTKNHHRATVLGCPNGIHSHDNASYKPNDPMPGCSCVESLPSVDCAGNHRNGLCGCSVGLGHHPTLPAAQLCSGKRDRQKERRLMKGFDFNCLYLDSATSVDEDCAMLLHGLSTGVRQQLLVSNPLLLSGSTGALGPTKNKSPNRNRFIRLARGIASKRNRANASSSLLSSTTAAAANGNGSANMGNNKWKQLIEATRSKVKPFSRSSESVNSDLNLQIGELWSDGFLSD